MNRGYRPWPAAKPKASASRKNRHNPFKGEGGGTPSKSAAYGRVRTVAEVAAELAAENRALGRR